MKLLFAVICLITCIFCGIFSSSKYTERKDFYLDFQKFNRRLKDEVSFAKSSIIEMINNEDAGDGVFYSYITDYLINNNDNINIKFLDNEEVKYLKSYFDAIGKSDRDSQLSFLNSSESYLEEKLLNSQNDEKKYKDLYLKLGILFGLIFFIALI